MKKIVILHPALWKQAMGGAEIQIFNLIQELLKYNFEIHYIFEDKGTGLPEIDNIQLHPLKKINIRKRFGNRWFLYQKQINKKLKQLKPDIIYTRFFSSWSGFAAKFADQNNVQHIWAIASDSDLSDKQISLLKPLNFFENQQINHAFKKASIILTQNQYQQKELKRRYERNGVIIRQSAETYDESKIIKTPEKTRIVWVANFKELKRPEYFIQIADSLKSYPELEFLMIGRASKQYEELIKSAKTNITNFDYLGELPNEEVNKILSSSHILVNTSDYEGFSNTFVQAWMRKVVVISMNSNPDDILTNHEIGFLCPHISDIVKRIKAFSQDKEQLKIIGERAYNYSNKNHSIEKNLEEVIKLMK